MTVVIPCAGLGSRLGEETKYINKAMVTIGQKPAFSYIFDQFSPSDEFVVLLGYKGEELRCSIESCYPNYNIKFVYVDTYAGEGSGLGYSLSCARNLLNKPFIFWACDTLIDSDIYMKGILESKCNYVFTSPMDPKWVGLYRAVKEEQLYSGKFTFLDKDEVDKDNLDVVSAYIGIAVINDHKKFWSLADKLIGFVESGEYLPLSKMEFRCLSVSNQVWYDIGNEKRLASARNRFIGDSSKIIMPKHKEAIWFVNGSVIKFHCDPTFIKKRVERVDSVLSTKMRRNGLNIPSITRFNKYTYCYDEVKGEVLSSVLNPTKFRKLVSAFFENYNPYNFVTYTSSVEFFNEFYINKTRERIKEYLTNHKWYPNINGRLCESPVENLEKILPVDFIMEMVPTINCHGDFHLENILCSEDGTFTLLDWRQGFVEGIEFGDQCYDLAKMLHSLIVSHRKVRKGKFSFTHSGKSCTLDIEQSEIYSQCREVLAKECELLKIDFRYVKLLTSLIFINIASCHDGDGCYPEFLYHLGAYLLDVCMEDYYG